MMMEITTFNHGGGGGGGSTGGYMMVDDISSSETDSHDERESDEDTEDASETDLVTNEASEGRQMEMKEQMYKDKRRVLIDQLEQMRKGTYPDFAKKAKKLQIHYEERLQFNDICMAYEMERIENEYAREKLAAVREFEQRKIELKENLIQDLEEKKKFVELEKQNMELASDFIEHKPISTRKLRRRPNDPIPMPQKGRRPSPQGQLNLTLEDSEVNEDLRILARSTSSKSSAASKRESKKQQ